MYYINEDAYPQNYDWLAKEQQKAILDYFIDAKKQCHDWCVLYSNTKKNNPSEAVVYKNRWKRADKELDAIDSFLSNVLNIKIEYDWCGHRGEYFLATYDDAVAENDYYYDIARDAEGDVDEYISGGDCENE